jgi:hypothetical protein
MAKKAAKKKGPVPAKTVTVKKRAVTVKAVKALPRKAAAIRKSLAALLEKTEDLEKQLTEVTSQSKTSLGGPAVGNAPTSPR